MEPILVPFSCY